MKNLRSRSIQFVVVAFLTALAEPAALRAQNHSVQASVASVTGKASLVRTARAYVLRKGDVLEPGDEIDTSAGGRVVIALSDGSVVTVHLGSRVLLKDCRHATSARELMEIFLGRVRFKIHHLGKRPNPYRVNSPTASIAVRGTEFIVDVKANGQTMVSVVEGLVEVGSRVDPQNSRLVRRGHSVIVRPGGEISLNLPGAGSELDARSKPLSDQKRFYYRDSEYAVTYAYNVYNRAITERTFDQSPSRFAAFADGHFDSLSNPAYAAEFKRADAQLYLLPSLSRPFEQGTAANRSPFRSPHRFDQTLSWQGSYFSPVGARWVMGGGVSISSANVESSAVHEARYSFPDYSYTFSFHGAAQSTTVNAALVAARRFGEGERTSLGLKIERLESRAALQTVEEIVERMKDPSITFNSARLSDARSRSHRTTATIGLAHDFARGDKLGLSISYGVAAGGFNYRREEQAFLFNNPVTGKQIASQAAEIALLLRGPVTRRLFYGVEAALLVERITDDFQYRRSLLTLDRRAQQPRLGAGLGFALLPKTLLSFDLSAAQQDVREARVEITADDFFPDSQRYRATFFNGHLGLQTDLGRRFLLGASLTRIYETRYFELFDYTVRRRATFSTLGFGWRVRPGWLAQYLFSTDYGQRGPSHTLLLRHNFSFGGKKSPQE